MPALCTTSIDTGIGDVDVLVVAELRATANADSGGFSGLVTLGVMSPTAIVNGYVGGYVRDGVDLTAG